VGLWVTMALKEEEYYATRLEEVPIELLELLETAKRIVLSPTAP